MGLPEPVKLPFVPVNQECVVGAAPDSAVELDAVIGEPSEEDVELLEDGLARGALEGL